MKRVLYIGAVLFLLGTTFSNAQKTTAHKADKQYDNYQYIEAIETYKKAVDKGYKTVEVLEHLGNAHYFTAQYTEAAKWYGELFGLQETNEDPEYYLRYSLSLKATEDYELANEYLGKYYQARGEARPELETYLDIIEGNSWRYEIENLEDLNSDLSDFGTTIYKEELIFSSTRKAPKKKSQVNQWNKQAYSALYSSKPDEEGNFKEPKIFSDKLDSKFNESTPVFTNDGRTVYFTRNNYLNKRGYDDEKTTLLKIYRATLKDGKWTDITELPFNSDDYTVAHPALSPDNRTLYFSSDMPGGEGDADIWKVTIYGDGTFGTPVNLGTTVNTEGRESFPFVSKENELYYASNGKLGLGGLDIFMSKIADDGKYEEAINVGKPINGPMDDFAFYIDTETNTGFFTSNREDGKGDDDIYKFTEFRKLICEQAIVGIVTDIDTGEILPGAEVTLYDEEDQVIATTIADEEARYSFDNEYVVCDTSYRIKAEKEGYSPAEKLVKTPQESGELQVDIALKTTAYVPKVGDNLADSDKLNIPIIYFDLDKSFIRPDAAVELTKVLNLMKEYPQMRVDIRSHTDCRASYAYNERLSDRRAKSTREWLINQGIEAERLTAKGYGESQLLNDCACEPTNESHCTEEEHQLNRRSEFIVMHVGDKRK